MRGPKAPKDPTKKRPGLYLMLDKDIAGLPGRDGSCRDTNYMEGRLVEQVKGICGDVDEEGRLVVRTDSGEVHVFTGEVSVHGIYGAV